MRKEFNRCEQVYWILRRGDPWKICDQRMNPLRSVAREICYNEDFLGKIMLCDNIEEVEETIKSFEELA